ncbi:muscarinic acetylcholine receptor M3-like [Megalops cyprinoides]|uniref:muscarinic acetylcholine receptor M3-like n=1 Tax=Megalops cyprinoides TaxID=118141 RepID=UPI0018648BAF|nr:muscarinic acetylcholine receptor M3-like [Megalops cyprinoides]XP_036402324.1 muscarinic acetylcholine receptor M3-like [Megalops cyprinoides]XP_036402325.1 muscarinic acetylcholine receptor M3-like [Megalops cyprinoides]XP_036402326.1 muscarinic acetylcholine receptor M3-like [Megalops cyprinoides]
MDRSYNSTEPSLYLTSSWTVMSVFRETVTLQGNQWAEPLSGTDNDSILSANSNLTSHSVNQTAARSHDPLGGHTVWQVVLIILCSGLLSLVTIIGNILVVVAFKVNKQLKTVNNYFLLSLAVADLIIGVISMNLYTTYIVMGQWAMGSWACDLWLAIDYVASNASVMNLLVISFDRYFSVTRPLTYRAKRTTKRAGVMIGLAWAISFVLWAPAILFWQYFVGKRTVPSDECYIQFLSEPIITFCTAIAAFYLPVTIMSVLYWRIYKETENRSRELAGLQASGSESETARFVQTGSSRSCSSYELGRAGGRGGSIHRAVSRLPLWPLMRAWRPADTDPDRSSCDSWNNNDTGTSMDQSGSSDEEEIPETRAIFSIVLNLPGIRPPVSSQLTSSEDLDASEDDPLRRVGDSKESVATGDRGEAAGDGFHQRFSKLPVQSMPSIETPKPAGAASPATKSPSAPLSLKDAALARRFAVRTRTQITKRKRMSLVKEKKAAQTLSAILFAFIITWTPYNIMVLVNTFCKDCIPQALWALGYWLCYVNSTVNPMCYALCNKTFRTTFRMILLCQWDRRRKQQFQQRHSVVFRRRIPGDST